MKTYKWFFGVSLVALGTGCGTERGSQRLDAMLRGLADADFDAAAANSQRVDARRETGALLPDGSVPRDFVLPGDSAIAWAIPGKRSLKRVERPVGGSLWAQHAGKVGRLDLGPGPQPLPR